MADREIFPGIWVSPAHRFGRPRVKALGVEAEAIIQRFVAGDSILDLTHEYGNFRADIEAALRWGCLSREQRARRLKQIAKA